ncbi:hypothetical protein AYI70_g11815, partial [Smittium culicis]
RKDEFLYKKDIRAKSDRKELHGSGCPCCSKFYELAGPIKSVENPPDLTNRPKNTSNNNPDNAMDTDSHSFMNPETEMTPDEHKQRISRHKSVKKNENHSSEFWSIDFP